jgi:NitT/TauT family transport system substrate-binding protein
MRLWIVCGAIGLALVSAAGCKDRLTSQTQERPIVLQLNWKPEAEFGGFYAAQEIGAFQKHGLKVDIVPGGSGTPTVQMVGSGTVDFALVSADELLIARSRGNPVVALFTVYQTCPQGIMVHASRGLKNLAALFDSGGTLAIQRGLPYADFLEKKYSFSRMKIVPSPNGDISTFLRDPNFAQQCFITSEPILARKGGADPQTFLIAEAGYNPYTTVLVTRDDYLKAHPETVKAMVLACREGWRDYLADPGPANLAMGRLNATVDAETFAQSAAAQKPLIETDDARGSALGAMTLDRWRQLSQQLVALKVIDTSPPAEQCFVDVDKLPATSLPSK